MDHLVSNSDRPISFRKNDWIILIGLILLSLIPVLAGIVRLTQLARQAVTLENVRFFASPTPAILHIVSVSIYCVLGAFQFAPSIRLARPQWHRRAGKLLIPLGLLAALSGLWMTHFYPAIKYDGYSLYLIRLIVGTSMVICIGFGLQAIRARNFNQHGAWMIRAYALGLGAGTQVLTHLPWFLFPNIQGELTRTLFMSLGWLINIIFAEWIIQKQLTKGKI